MNEQIACTFLCDVIFVFSSVPVDNLDVEFDEKLKCIKVTGLADSVKAATKLLNAKYIDVICTDNLQIVNPGDFLYLLTVSL